MPPMLDEEAISRKRDYGIFKRVQSKVRMRLASFIASESNSDKIPHITGM